MPGLVIDRNEPLPSSAEPLFNGKALEGFGKVTFRKSGVDRPADVAAGQAARETMKRLEELAVKRAEAAKQVEDIKDTPKVGL